MEAAIAQRLEHISLSLLGMMAPIYRTSVGKSRQSVKKLLENLVGQGKGPVELRNGCDSKRCVRAETRREMIRVVVL
jgi:hypothetical protein